MASSSPSGVQSVGYAQDHIKVSCDLCEEEKDAVSHCTQCVKNMCVSCQKIHDKLHTGHKIITIFEGRIIKYLNTECPTHHLLFTYYCEKCKINVCNVCRQENHNKCNLVDIGRHAEILKTHLTKKVAEQRKCLDEIDKTSDNIDDHLKNFDRIFDSQISLMETETNKKHRDLDIQKLNFIQLLKSQQTSTHKTVQDQKQTLLDLRTSIDNITESIKVKIDLVPDAGVLQLVNECNDKLETTSKKTTFDLPNPSTFTPSTVSLGSLQNTDSTTIIIDTRIDPPDTSKDLPDTESPSPVPSLHHSTPADPSPSLRHEISVVRQLSVGRPVYSCTSDGSTCWVGLWPPTVKLYNQCGDQLLSVDLSHDTHHTALTTTGEVLVSGYNTTVISRVNKTGQVRKFTDTSARDVERVRGLVTTRQDDVFVCVTMAGKTKDKVLTFSARGKKISELNSHFFTSTTLCGIHAVSRDTFCVQDGEGWEGGRLVFVDGGGQLVRYIDRTTTELQSDIWTVAGDRHGHLIIATGDSEYIHVLSGEGTCKRTYHIQGSGEVDGVSVGEDDVLWIGTGIWDTGKLIVAKYLE